MSDFVYICLKTEKVIMQWMPEESILLFPRDDFRIDEYAHCYELVTDWIGREVP